MDFVLTEGRSAVAEEARVAIQNIMDLYNTGLSLVGVNIITAQPPKQVQAAFSDAVKAREDEERTKNEARAYAADILPKARGEANAIREQALAYKERVVAAAEGETSRFLQVLTEYKKAPEVTRQRIYLEAVEAVLANSNKVMIDVEGGNNLTYLPLDRLMQPRDAVTANAPARSAVPQSDSSITRQAIEELRRRGENLREESHGQSRVVIIVPCWRVLVASQSIFTVHQGARAPWQLGQIVTSDYEPGLHFKLPLFQNVLKFDGRIQSLDSELQLFLTSEKKNVKVDSFVKWRISDVARYFTSTSGIESNAALRLSEIVQKRLKDEFSKRTVVDVVSGERADIMNIATEELSSQAAALASKLSMCASSVSTCLKMSAVRSSRGWRPSVQRLQSNSVHVVKKRRRLFVPLPRSSAK